MTRGLVLVADGVDETQLDYAYHRLREDAVLVDIAAPGGDDITTGYGHHRVTVSAGSLPPARRYDLVIVPGGQSPGRLRDDPELLERLESMYAAGDVVCAIAEGVELVAAIDGVSGRLVTGPAHLRKALTAAGGTFTDEAVTVDGGLVTVQDTEALPFGVAAALSNVVIRQDHADVARERPHWPDADAPG